jgi:hypothetical protein
MIMRRPKGDGMSQTLMGLGQRRSTGSGDTETEWSWVELGRGERWWNRDGGRKEMRREAKPDVEDAVYVRNWEPAEAVQTVSFNN